MYSSDEGILMVHTTALPYPAVEVARLTLSQQVFFNVSRNISKSQALVWLHQQKFEKLATQISNNNKET